MDDRNPEFVDQRPKRRKAKDNPYRIYSISWGTENPHYFVTYVNCDGNSVCLEISKELFDTFDRWELDDLSYLHIVERHQERYELTEHTIHRRYNRTEESIEEKLISRDEQMTVRKAINQLTEAQKKRLYMYYWCNMTLKVISRAEGCTYQAVQASIRGAHKKLREILL